MNEIFGDLSLPTQFSDATFLVIIVISRQVWDFLLNIFLPYGNGNRCLGKWVMASIEYWNGFVWALVGFRDVIVCLFLLNGL